MEAEWMITGAQVILFLQYKQQQHEFVAFQLCVQYTDSLDTIFTVRVYWKKSLMLWIF